MNRRTLTHARRLAQQGCFALRPLPLAAALLVLSEGALAQALPSQGRVIYGNVTQTQPDANTLNIHQGSNKAYVQYDSFSIGLNNKVMIQQPTTTSTFVGQVTGYDPSLILGQLQANGRVFLINPNGIVFGQHARVDVGSLVATTMSLSLADFLSDRILLKDNSEGRGALAGVVRNDGTIKVADGGFAVLAGRQVINTGQILAEQGRVGMIAASKLLVDVEGDGLLFFEVEGKDAEARLAQLGRIEANGGSVEMMAAARGQFADTVLNMSGVVQARGLGTRQGRVVIDGGGSGITDVSGTVDTQGLAAGQKGGDITVTGDRVLVRDTAVLDASGMAGGGRLLVGGDFHGANAAVRNAQVTAVGSGARLRANALQSGQGGDVVVWADDTTRYFGGIESRGGVQGGDGGNVEVSGKQSLAYQGAVDTLAARGKLGTLLLDPRDISITANGAALNWTAAAGVAAPGDAEVNVASINSDTTATVTLAADRDVFVNAAINIANAGTGLSITAGNDLTVAQSIATNNGAVQLTATAGAIKLNDNVNAGTANVTLSGAVTLGGASATRSLTGGVVSVDAVTGAGKNLTLVADTSATLNGTVTGVAALNATVSTTTVNADVTTTAGQNYGAVTLGGAGTTRTLSGATVSLGAVTGGGKDLTVSGSTSATLGGAVTGVGTLNASGSATTAINGDVTTTAGQSYGAVTLGGAGTGRALSGTTVSLGAVTGGGKDLTLTATTSATLGGGVSGVNKLDASGAVATSLGANVTTTADQTYGGTVTLTAPSTFTGTAVGFNNVVAGANDLGIRANTIAVAGTATGSAAVTLAPMNDASATISVNSATAADLSISAALLAKFSGFSTVNIGTPGGVGNITLGDIVLPGSTLVRNSSGTVSFAKVDGPHSLSVQTATGTIELNDLIGGTTALTGLDLNGPVTVGTGAIKTSGDQVYGGAVTQTANALLLDAGTGKVSLTSVDGGGATHDLTLKSSHADADAIKTTGTISNLRGLSVQGASTLGGNVTTSGDQSYTGVATLASNVTLDATAAKVSLAGVTGATHDLTVKTTNTAADAIKTTAAIAGVGALRVQGKATLGANVGSTGSQTYTSAVALSSGVGVTSSAGNVRFQGTVDGAQALTVNAAAGNARFDGAVGSGTALTSLGVTAASVDINGGAVTTTGAQTYTTPTVTLGADTTFTTSNLQATGNLNAGAHDLSVFADAVGVAGSILSTGGHASIAGRLASNSIGLAGGAGDLQVTSALLAKFAGFGGLTIGRADGSADITFGNMTGGNALNRSMDVRNGTGRIVFGAIDTTVDGVHDLSATTGGGAIVLNGNVGNGNRLRNLTLDGPITVGTASISTAGTQTYDGEVTLAHNVAIEGSGVHFGDKVDGDGREMTVQANGLGQRVRFDGEVKDVWRLSVTGAAEVGASISTTLGQIYNGTVTLSGNATFSGTALNFNGDLTAGTHDLGLLTDSLLVGGTLSGTGSVQIGSFDPGKDIVVAGTGSGTELVVDASTFSQFSTFSRLIVGRADGTGTITLGESGAPSFTLPVDLTLLSQTGDISVQSAINGAHSLTLNTGGTTVISAGVSGLTSLATDAGGTTRLGASVTTTGTQTYGDNVVVTSDVTVTGSAVAFGGTVNGASAGAQNLTVNGNARFAQAVGAVQSLRSLQVSGTSQFDQGGVRTSLQQDYTGAATVGAASTFTSDNSYVHFGDTLGGPHAVTINAAAGSGTDLMGAVNVASLSVTGGSLYLGGGSVTTTGAQTYASSTYLAANTTLTGTDIAMNGTVNGARTLAINASGTSTLGGAVGGNTALTSLSTQGATNLNGGSVNTIGAQSYGGAVTLGANTTLNANTVDFNGTVNGARTLLVNDSGTTTFHGNVGSTTALTSLTTTAGGSTVLPAQVTTTGAQSYGDPVTLAANTALSANSVSMANLIGASHSLAIATPGNVDFNGSISGLTSLNKTGVGTVRFIGANGLTTSGAQSYGGDVEVLSGDATFDASALTFSGDITGANNLGLSADVISVAGAVTGTGAGTFSIAPRSAATAINLSGGAGSWVNLNTVSGFAQHVIGRTDGTGTINVGATTLSAETTVQSGTGAVNFGALDGAHALTVNTGGVTTFNGNVTGLTSLSTDAAGSTHFNGNTASVTAALNFGDAVVYGGSVSFSAPSITLGGGASGGTNLTLVTNSLTLGDDLSGSGELTLQATAAGTTVGLAGGAGALQITQATLDRITGFTSQTFGRTDGGAVHANALTMARDTKVQSGGNVTFSGTVDGAHALTVNAAGTTAFQGDVGGTTALTNLSTDAGGNTTIAAAQVKASGTVSFGDAVTYTGDTTITGATQQFAAGITGGNNLTLVANTLSAGGPISGSGILTLLPSVGANSIGLAGAAGDLQITQALLDQTTGFTRHVIGRGTGGVDILSGALTLRADTTVQSGTGEVNFQSTVDGAHALSVNTAGQTRFQGNVGGATALSSVTTDAPGITRIDAGLMRTTGAQTYNDPVVSSGTLSLVAQAVTLHTPGNLRLGLVNLGLGGSISTDGVLVLSDSLTLGGGVLTLRAGAGPGAGVAFADPELAARPGLVSGSLILKEAAAAIVQTGGTVSTAAGSTLDLQAVNRGSILVDRAGNDIAGDLKAVSGPSGDTNTARLTGSGTLPLGFVRLASNQIHAAGIEGDAVKLTANALTTASGTKIRARLPYINAQGIESSIPALTLVLGQPNVVNQFGTPASGNWIQVDLGDQQGGYLTVRPKGAGAGASAVYLGGFDGNVPFYDGTGKSSEIQVYFNGRVPSTPQEVGALSAVTAVIEESRRARFDEAVRTENVSSRLRTGVIAEVGAGRPATEGTESIRMPETCTPTPTLGCQ